jgi:uncharacterized protein GlcG (DUF336 family)
MENTDVQQMIEAAKDKAAELGIKICIAIVDEGALLSAFFRMSGTFRGSVDVAIAKARTSALFPMSTRAFGERMRNNTLTGMEGTNQGLIGFAGGVPIFSGGKQIGAIGISGGTSDQDEVIANYAISTLDSDA